MNKSTIKGFISGSIFTAVLITIGIITVLAAGGIKSAVFNANKVIFNGNEINLASTPMVSIVKEGEENFSNYMPVRAVLEAMGYTVDWDGTNNVVIVNDKKTEGENINQTKTDTPVAYEKENMIPLSENYPETTFIVNGVELKGIVYNGKEYYDAYQMCKAVATTLVGYSSDLSDLVFKQKPLPDERFPEYPVIFTVSFDEPCFIIYKGFYMEREYFEQNILPLYQ